MKRSEEKELMDLPGQHREILEEDLRNLRILNRCLGGSRTVMRGLKQAAQTQGVREFSLLDVGTGSADIPTAIVDWTKRQGFVARIVGLEMDPVTVQTAFIRTKQLPEISILRGDGTQPPFQPRSFDFVLASQVLHHFSAEDIVSNLQIWSRIARKAIIVSDLIRHPLAYHGIRLLTHLSTRNFMTLTDAPLSVKRAFTMTEWRDLFSAAGIGHFELFSVFPFRVVAIVRLDGEHAKL